MQNQLDCHICQISFSSSKSFSRWNIDFCSIKCLHVELKLTQQKEAELEKLKKSTLGIRSPSYHDVGGGGA